MKPLITVIVPAYNAEKKVGKCLEALLSQSYKNLEIFVVDDGSSDKTQDIVKSFSKKHKNIKLLKQKRKGPGAAKNLASKKAKGKLLVFVDSDEYCKKNYIEKLTAPIRKGKARTSIGAWVLAYPKSPWARCRFKETHKTRQHALSSGVFRSISLKDFKKLGGFDPKKGYSDDRIPNNFKRARVDDAIFDHDVDSNLPELYKKRKWIGSSIKNNPKNFLFKVKATFITLLLILFIASLFFSRTLSLILIILAIIPILIKAIMKAISYGDLRLLVHYPIYAIVTSFAMLQGLLFKEYKS